MNNDKITWNYVYNEYSLSDKSIKESSMVTYSSIFKIYIKPFFNNGKQLVYLSNMSTIEEFHKYINKRTYIRGNKKHLLSFKTKCKIHSFLDILFDFSKRKDYINKNFAEEHGNFKQANDQIVIDNKIRFFLPTEFDLFIAEIDELIWKAFFNITYWSGMRKGELQALKWHDIDFKNWKFNIISTLSNKTLNGGFKLTNTKNRKNRSIDMLEQSKEILLSLYDKSCNRIGFNHDWFVFGGLKPLSSTSIDRRIDMYINSANSKLPLNDRIPDLTHHEIGRHSHGSLLAFLGVWKENIAIRLGDTVEVIEKYYLHAYKEHKDTMIINSTKPEMINRKMHDYFTH